MQKYLIGDGDKIYTVAEGALVEVVQEKGYIDVEYYFVSSLWVRVVDLTLNKDTGNARAVVFPIEAGKTYRIILTETGGRERIVTCADDPRDMVAGEVRAGIRAIANTDTPVAGTIVTFTARENEHWVVYHASAAGIEPKTEVDFEISALVNSFLNYGVETMPEGSLLLGLTKPSALYWQDTDGEMPSFTATVTGEPLSQQSIISDEMRVDVSGILGIESVTAEYEGDPLIAVSFDGGDFKIFANGGWSNTDTGMSISDLLTITTEQWDESITGVSYLKIRVILTEKIDKLRNLIFNFIR